jgi:carboxymethylenebutenolidase
MRRWVSLIGSIVVGGVLAAGCDSSKSAAASGALPAGAAEAKVRLNSSPRHGEWAMIQAAPGDSIRAWVVYPERSDKAPVVVVIHEIYGLTPWVRGVADQLAADGFIAIAPDLMTSHGLAGTPEDGPSPDQASAVIRTLDPQNVQRHLDATARYGMALPAATQKYGVIGFCWGGTTSFTHALHAPDLDAAIVYYGSTPRDASFSSVQAPILGLYGGEDNRVNSTIPVADSGMRAAGKSYESRVFAGAGHGFLRAQTDSVRGAANRQASEEAWSATIAFFRRHLGS